MKERRKLISNTCTALMVLLLFQSCSFGATSEISDLRLVRVEVISQDKIPEQDKYWPAGAITEPLFLVTFSTKADLEKLARGEHYNIDSITSICRGSDIDKDRILRGFPSVLDAVGRIDAFRSASGSARGGDHGEFEYHIYFDIRQSGIHGFYPYDLIHAPADVCITVNGAQELGFSITKRFTSNVLVVPRKTISMAIERAGQQ